MAIIDRDASLKLTTGGPVTPEYPNGIFRWGNALIGTLEGVPVTGGSSLSVRLTPTTPFSVDRPRVIQVQPRQSENTDFQWPDQFSVMVTETSKDYIKVMVRRMDVRLTGGGWGQQLMLDFFIVDDGVIPPAFPE